MSNKILVTGGKGFIGSKLVRKLKCDFIDLVDGTDIRDVKIGDYDIVYHLAALRSVPRSFDDAREFFDTNVFGTYNIARQAKRLVNISSSSVYSVKSPYAISKKCAEAVGECFPNVVNLKLFNVFGEGQIADTLIPNFARAMANNKEVYLYGDGFQMRDFTYVDDVVNEIVRYGKSKMTGTYDVGYGEPHSILEVFQLMALYFDYKKEPIRLDERVGDFRSTKANTTIKDPVGFSQGLARTVRWWKA